MAPSGYIRRIGSYTDAEYEKMRCDLQLSMSVPFIRHIAGYYQNQARRDPSIEEFQLLDAFVTSMQQDPGGIAPVKLNTNDSFVAGTYGDMMEKRRQLSPESMSPMSLREGLGLANAYLARAGRRNALPRISVSFEKQEICEGNLVSCGGDALLVRREKAAPRPDDILMLSLPTKEERWDLLLSDPAFDPHVVSISSVSKGGLMAAALREGSGLYLDLRRLLHEEVQIPWSAAVTGFAEARILRVSRSGESPLLKAASEKGVKLCTFAALNNTAMLSLCRGANEVLSWDARFIRSLISLCRIEIILEDEDVHSVSSPDMRPAMPHNCRYLHAHRESIPSYSTRFGDVCVSASCNTAAHSGFFTALYTGLTSVMNLALSGAYYRNMQLAAGLTLPKMPLSRLSAGTAMALSLGLYRLQAELGIPCAALSVTDGDVDMPALSMFALAEADPIPRVFTKADSRVSLLPCPVLENGMPDFEALRPFLDRLSDLYRQGVLLSAAPFFHEDVRDAVAKMEGNGLFCRLTEDLPLSSLCFVILESTEVVEGAADLGCVCSEEGMVDSQDSCPQLSPIRSLIWSEVPQILILSEKKDADARMLAACLSRRGAQVQLFDRTDDGRILSRALLGAQALILCDTEGLPSSPQIQFAYRTMREAGGCVLTLGQAQMPNAVHFPAGLDEEALSVLTRAAKEEENKNI